MITVVRLNTLWRRSSENLKSTLLFILLVYFIVPVSLFQEGENAQSDKHADIAVNADRYNPAGEKNQTRFQTSLCFFVFVIKCALPLTTKK